MSREDICSREGWERRDKRRARTTVLVRKEIVRKKEKEVEHFNRAENLRHANRKRQHKKKKKRKKNKKKKNQERVFEGRMI